MSDPGSAKERNYVREDNHSCLFLQENKWLFCSEGGDGCQHCIKLHVLLCCA